MRLILFISLLLVSVLGYSQCNNCNTVDEAVLDTISTSEFLYYDGKPFNCISQYSQLNEILESIDSMICLTTDTVNSELSGSLVSDSLFDVIDSLINTVGGGKNYVITSNDTSLYVTKTNDSTFNLSFNVDRFNDYIFSDITLCDGGFVVNSFETAVDYLCTKYTSDSLIHTPKQPYMTVGTSANTDTIKMTITPFVTNPLTTDDCSQIFYYYNAYLDTSVIHNGSGIWNGGKAYGVAKDYYLPVDLSTDTIRVYVEMMVTRESCYSGTSRPTEFANNGYYVFTPITTNCGWGTGSGLWNTLSGKWCSE